MEEVERRILIENITRIADSLERLVDVILDAPEDFVTFRPDLDVEWEIEDAPGSD